MTLPSQFTFKITVFTTQDVPAEIKKFQVDENFSTDFNHLLAKIRSYYKFDGVKVFWTDSDGDEIKIDSDEDLQTAQTENTGGSLKLKVVLEDGRNIVREESSDMDVESDEDGVSSVDGNYILSLMVYVVQCLGLDPCESPHRPEERSVISYMIRVAAGLSTKLTKSALLMFSFFLLTLLSMFLPSYLINSIIYFILAFSLGLPIATLVLGHFLFGLITVSPNFVVTFLSMWALKSLLYRKRQQLLRLNLEYWNNRLEQTLSEEMQTRNVKQH